MTTYAYYPGCSIKGTGRAYEESLLAVFEILGLRLEEIDDWNCCGATAYMAIAEHEAYALSSRNLALAARIDRDVVTPCSACYLGLKRAQRALRENEQLRDRIRGAMKEVGLEYRDQVRVRHPLDVLLNDVGADAIAAATRRRLTGLKVAPYYGCQVVRPYSHFDDQENPIAMDRLIRAVGAEVVRFLHKVACCGGSQTGTVPQVGLQLLEKILEEANRREADVIATVCPLCQFNLDVFQGQLTRGNGLRPVPVVFFTQLLGVAFGLSRDRLGLDRCVVPVPPALTRRTADVS